MPLVILLCAAGMIGVLRTGFLLSEWSFYKLTGIEQKRLSSSVNSINTL